MSRVLCGFGLLAVLGVAGCAGCEPESSIECAYHGKSYAAGDSFAADDGCNQCICSEEAVIICTSLVCPGADGGVPDASGEDGSFVIEVDYPSSACALASIDGEAPTAAPTTGQRLALGAQDWPPPTAGATITSRSWRLVSAPAGTRAPLDPTGQLTPDLVGPYVLRATLGDDQGGTADHDCTLQVQPPAGLYVELVWDRSASDLDLRMIQAKDDGMFCTRLSEVELPSDSVSQLCAAELECAFDNCKAETQGARPDWDGDQVVGSAGDPTLLFDVTTGFGPEAISVRTPAPGSYLVVGYYWSSQGQPRPVRADVRLWVEGQLRGSASATLDERAWWEALRFTVPASGGDFCADSLVEGSERCGALPLCAPAPTCSECGTDADCGPGSLCSSSLARCLPRLSGCDNPGDCGASRACIPATQSCWEPECDGDQLACADPRFGCDDALRMCVLPPPVCAETDEPNNTLTAAIAVSGTSLAGTLCRGDVDVLAVAGHAGKRLRATVTFATTTVEHYAGNTLELLDTSGTVLHRRTFAGGPSALVATDVANAATYYLRLSGVATGTDLAAYQLSLSEIDALACATELGEPNDTVALAGNSVLTAGVAQRTLCGDSDIDCHQVVIPADYRLVATATVDPPSTSFDLVMLDVSGALLHQAPGYEATRTVAHSARGQAKTVVLRVSTFQVVDPAADTIQAYALDVALAPSPTCSETTEPNDTRAQATPTAPGTRAGVICDAQDLDIYRVEVPEGGGLSVDLRFVDAEGDLELRVENAAGASLVASTGTTDLEHVALSGLAAGPYYVTVYPFTGSIPAPDAQAYTLELSAVGWPDAGMGEDSGAGDAGAAEDAWVGADAGLPEDATPVEDAAPVEDAG